MGLTLVAVFGRLVLAGRRLRALDARWPLATDAAIAAVVALLGGAALADGSFDATIRPEVPAAPAAVPWLLMAGFTLCVLGCRSRPLGTLWAVVAACGVMMWWGLDHPGVLGAFVVLYSAGRRVPTAVLTWAGGALVAGVGASAGRWGLGVADEYVPLLVLLAGCALLGVTVQTRHDHAARLEIERDQRAQLAVAAERARIAREMHDIVAHNLAVIVALADGAACSLSDAPLRAKDLIDKVSASGREALGDMRRLVGVLRDGDGDGLAGSAPGPQPGLGDIDALVDQLRAAGMDVTVERVGEPRGWGPSAGLAVYRILQEALTNTMKHAGPQARARVRLSLTATGVDLDVTDDGAGRRRAVPAAPRPRAGGPDHGHGHGQAGMTERAASHGGHGHGLAGMAERAASDGGQGHGLAGMAERAAFYGGHVDAGPLAGGGWRVHAHLPFGPAV